MNGAVFLLNADRAGFSKPCETRNTLNFNLDGNRGKACAPSKTLRRSYSELEIHHRSRNVWKWQAGTRDIFPYYTSIKGNFFSSLLSSLLLCPPPPFVRPLILKSRNNGYSIDRLLTDIEHFKENVMHEQAHIQSSYLNQKYIGLFLFSWLKSFLDANSATITALDFSRVQLYSINSVLFSSC